MKQKTKKIIQIIWKALLSLVGIKYPSIQKSIKDAIEDIQEITNDKELQNE